jgi:hypothetical protein
VSEPVQDATRPGRFKLRRAAGLVVLALSSMAHVGSPDTFFVGNAGPFRICVVARLPGVIPGRGQVTVRVLNAAAYPPTIVTVRAGQWNVGIEGAPPPEIATPVPGDADLYAAELWFMTPSSYVLFVDVDGRAESGTAIVPMMALATSQRALGPGLAAVLGAAGLFLAVGLVSIVGAAVKESVVAPGALPDAKRRRRSRFAMAVSALLLGAAMFGGRLWWNAEATTYRESILYRPFRSEAGVRDDGGRLALTLSIRDPRWTERRNPLSRYNALTPDHGKLMHMFLVRGQSGDVLAHVHPIPRTPDAMDFDVELPPIPAGRYAVFADIVHESGYAQTMTATVDIPSGGRRGTQVGDPDDSWFEGAAASEAAEAQFQFLDGSRIAWRRGAPALKAQEERTLTFSARDATGRPLALEPYLGMAAHVLVMRDDGSVFVHLHPAGSISMAALQRFSAEWPERSDAHALHEHPVDSEVSIPFAFPTSGRYHVWVQMKHGGRVMTAAFDATVS